MCFVLLKTNVLPWGRSKKCHVRFVPHTSISRICPHQHILKDLGYKGRTFVQVLHYFLPKSCCSPVDILSIYVVILSHLCCHIFNLPSPLLPSPLAMCCWSGWQFLNILFFFLLTFLQASVAHLKVQPLYI